MPEGKSAAIEPSDRASTAGQSWVLRLIGMPALMLGHVFTTMSVMHQLRNSVQGRQYFDWIAMGVVTAVFGLALLLLSRPTRRQLVVVEASALGAAVAVAVLVTLWPVLLGRG